MFISKLIAMLPITDSVLIFSILMLIFLLAPIIAERFRLPELVVLLIAGVVIGPNGVGLMVREGGIELFGTIGLIYIMFVAGLETDAHQFKRTATKSAVFGVISFIIPQVAGAVLAHYLLNMSWTAAVLLASMFASHTLIAYPIASRFGITKSEPVSVAVGGTILTNTFALLVLAVIADTSQGAELGTTYWLGFMIGMTVLGIAIGWILPKIAGWFFRSVPEKGGAQFVFVLAAVCLFSYFSKFAKMEPIIGAFLTGVALNRLIPSQSTLMNRLMFIGNTFFIPFFLISVGMLINLRALFTSPKGIWVAIVMSVAVIVTKYVAAYLAGWMFSYDRASKKVVFGLSVPQAAATLAAVLVGYELKIFDGDVLNGTIVMILVTCTLGCYVVERYGRRLTNNVALKEDTAPRIQRIMVGVFNIKAATRLLDVAFLLRDTAREGRIYPVTVVSDMTGIDTQESIAKGEKLIAQCISQVTSAEAPFSPRVRLDINPSDGLIRLAHEVRCELLLTSWTGRLSLKNIMLGSVNDKLIQDSQSRLMLCRIRTPINTCSRILMPFPELGCRRSDLLLLMSEAKRLASQIGAELNLIIPNNFDRVMLKKIEQEAPRCNLKITEIVNWKKMDAKFQSMINTGDLIFFPQERRESIRWNPRFERLAEITAEKNRENNMFVSFPVLEGRSDESNEIDNVHLTKIEETRVLGTNLHDNNINDAICSMISEAFPHEVNNVRLISRGLIDSLNSYPLELTEGVLLLHTRSYNTSGEFVVVGHYPTSYKLPKVGSGRFTTIIALISSVSEGHERHLNELASLARTFLAPETVIKIKEAKNVEGILVELKEKIKEEDKIYKEQHEEKDQQEAVEK